MEIYALIGVSGTGKSHHAPLLAKKYKIDYILDDGLLIKGSDILAGRSAKRENTRYGAIKRALYTDPEHSQQVKEKLEVIKPNRLLVLSTSRRMADVITKNLDLPAPDHYLDIEEISDPESIQTALAVRAKENRHVIPLPTFTIKKDFPGYIVDPLRSFFSLPSSQRAGLPVERSVVRPVFSTLGSFYLTEHVITDLVKHIISQYPGVYKALNIELENGGSKSFLNIDLAVDPAKIPGLKIDLLLRRIQQSVKDEVEYLTGFYLDQVNVNAKKLHFDENLVKDRKALRKLVASQNGNNLN